MTPLDVALGYIRRGWNPVPNTYRTKVPIGDGWEARVIGEAEAPHHFNGAPLNVGVVLGPTSAGLTDVDLDCDEAVALAPFFLPRTTCRFGRLSRPNSHWLYRTTLGAAGSKAVRRYKDPDTAGTILELRIGGANGAQTVFPGSVHETGEEITWTASSDPSAVSDDKLQWCVQALAVAIIALRGWPAAGLKARHDAALVLGGFLARARWRSEEASHLVRAVAQTAGDPEIEDRGKAAHDQANAFHEGGNAFGLPALIELLGEKRAKKLAEWVGFKGEAPRSDAKPDERAPPPRNDIITEDGAACAFRDRHEGRLLFCHDTGRWHEWTGAAWVPNRSGLAFQWARELARELCANDSPKTRFVVSKTAFAAGVERFCRSDPAFAVTIEGWDRDPWLLGTPGGTVDLRTGELRKARPEERITKLTAVAPAATADCPTWLRFLDDVTRSDQGYIRFIRQWAGYSLTGDTREQALCFAYGGGGNGKGVLIHVLAGIMGGYALNAAMETFTASKGDRHPTEIAALRGARLVTASETEQGRQWAESRIKQLTGGDTMRARFMRQDEFEFRPVLKLLIIGNNKPGLSTVDDAARRRFNLLPFLFKPSQPDPRLEEKLEAEWPGILRWIIDGCLDWQANGLVRPEVVKDATSEYFEGQDLFGMWLEEKCIVDHGNPYRKATTGELFASWSIFAKANNDPAGSQTSFGDRLDKLGFKKNKNVPTGVGGRARGFEGIEVRHQAGQQAAE